MVQYVTKRRDTKAQRGGLCMDEDEGRYYFLQLLSAVEYCHKHHVAHRSAKEDSFMVPTKRSAGRSFQGRGGQGNGRRGRDSWATCGA